MSITRADELSGMLAVSELVAQTLKAMRLYARPGMSAKDLDEYGGALLSKAGARSAPKHTYRFPGWTCISVNEEVAHGIPHAHKILREGDLVNIDVSAELNGFWSDNGGSFVLGRDIHGHQPLVDASREILREAIAALAPGRRVAEIGRIIQQAAYHRGYTVIRNLTGHGIGTSLHEAPHEIANYYDRFNLSRFKPGAVVAIETFISTKSGIAVTQQDGWTLKGNQGGFVAQHEHTVYLSPEGPRILTLSNDIWAGLA